MKRLLFLLLFFPLICQQSCVKDEKNLFDGSAAERMARALKEYNTILNEAAPNGWLMEYYSLDAGGYTYLCKFETLEGQLNGKVSVASELDVNEVDESLYELKSDQSAILTFNTYNPLFHYFSEPYSGNRNGDRGDYEFTFIKVGTDSIIMHGKKYNDRIVMTPFKGADWKSYLQSLITLREKCDYATFKLFDKGNLVCPVEMDSNERWISFVLSNKTIDQRFIYTATGIKFYEPVEIGAIKYKYFDWDDTNKAFKCSDANAYMKLDIPSDYLFYNDVPGTYKFEFQRVALTTANPTRITRTVTVTEKVPGQTYNVSGIMDGYNFEMRYVRTTGSVGFWVQSIGTYNGNTVGACVINAGYSTYSWGTSYWYKGRWNKRSDDFKIIFEDSHSWDYEVGGLYVVYTANWPGSGTLVPGGNSVFLGIIMTKQ